MHFKTILIDPPWKSPEYNAYSRNRNRKWEFPTMSGEELAALPIGKLAEEGSHLWLWTTQVHLPLALELVEVWGFKYQVCVTAVKPHGFGNWWAKTTQFLIFAYLSPLRMQRKCRPTHFLYKPLGHAIKPEEGYQLVETVSFPPRIELFARKKRSDWVCLGNEVTGRDISEDLRIIRRRKDVRSTLVT